MICAPGDVVCGVYGPRNKSGVHLADKGLISDTSAERRRFSKVDRRKGKCAKHVYEREAEDQGRCDEGY